MSRAQRRHHRARRIAAVQRERPWLAPAFVRLHARTRCPCSCSACKDTRRQLAQTRVVETRKNASAEIGDVFDEREMQVNDAKQRRRWRAELVRLGLIAC